METLTEIMYNFHRKAWILFYILLQLKKGIFSTPDICSENNITKHLNESITKILALGIETAIELVSTVKDHKLMEFEYNISKTVCQFQNKLFFQNISMQTYIDKEFEEWTPRPLQIHWEFLENKITLFYEDLRFTLDAIISAVKGESPSIIRAYPGFKNFTLTALKSNIENNNSQFSFNTTYTGFRDWMNFYPRVNWYNNNLTQTEKNALAKEMMPAFLAMIHENLFDNRNFSHTLEGIFQAYEKPRKEIISLHPDFLNNEQQYYYLIAENPIFCFTLKDIVIGGLSNFKSFKIIRRTSGIFTHTLYIRDVRGKMTLDYGFENETDLELDFQIDRLLVLKKDDSDCIFIHAKYYTVNRTKENVSLKGRQSEVIMNGLELAMASSLFPSMKTASICDQETSLNNFKISNESDWKTVKETYKGWIPFNDD